MPERRLRTTYERDMALFPTRVSRFWLTALVAVLVVYPFALRGSWLPILGDSPDFWLTIAITVLIASIGSLGLNLLSGFAGQISLGHAFFLGVGGFVGATVASPSTTTLSGVDFWGLGWPWWTGVIAGGLVAAIIGVVIGPTAVRLRGLYLSLVTLGLVFLGEWLFTSPLLEPITGAARGRSVAPVSLPIPGLSENEEMYFVCLLVAVVAFFIGKNIARGRVGRAFQATRDRDIAAEVIGVNVTWAKLTAFGLSSFFAGASGYLLAVFLGNPLGASFGGAEGLLLSVEYVAMIVIGGIGTVLGSALGAIFVVGLQDLIRFMSEQGWLPAVSAGGEGFITATEISTILFGLFIVVFLAVEPLGLYGLWIRARNFWKGWPFSY